MLRNPEKRAINPMNAPSLEGLSQQLVSHAITWHTLECELVTPMYGGGVQSTVVDTKMPIRVASIRGQLRFWWRLLAKNKWKLGGAKAIRKAEFDLWGGMSDGDEDGKASKVLLRVENISGLATEPWAIFEEKPTGVGYKTIPTPKKAWADVPYILFPAQGKKPDSIKAEIPHSLAKAGLKWDLKFAFIPSITNQEQSQVWETLRWWANFGGVGARNRRGLGAVYVTSNLYQDKILPLNQEDIDEVQGCKIVIRAANKERESTKSAYQAWKESVDKLRSFRQVNIGRKTNSNRSRWSEPDAIRHYTGQSSPQHSDRLTLDNIFPRAVFGLPIIFKFQNDGNTSSDEPAQTSLQPVYKNELLERLTSPLILRPYYTGKGWQASVLLLPNEYFNDLKFKLVQGKREIDVLYGSPKQFSTLAPITENGGGDPLQAFLTYFAK